MTKLLAGMLVGLAVTCASATDLNKVDDAKAHPGAPKEKKAKTEQASTCTPPQPKAPCKIDTFWNGGRCIDKAELVENGKATREWPASQWKDFIFGLIVTKNAGKISSPTGMAIIEPELVKAGASLQRNSAGEIRGRIFLPTGDVDDLWSRAVDIGAWCKPWVWQPR